jgi:uncharacterized membrane protein
MTEQRSDHVELTRSGRLEAFSDGVFAIAITLLVLDLAVPARDQLHGGGLGAALAHQWPSYFAYLVSFLVIGIIWVNHHTMFSKVNLVDRPVLFANLALLLVVSVIPFPTRLLAEYLTAGSDAHTAAAVYSCAMLAVGLAYSVLWISVTRDVGLLHDHVDPVTSPRSVCRSSARLRPSQYTRRWRSTTASISSRRRRPGGTSHLECQEPALIHGMRASELPGERLGPADGRASPPRGVNGVPVARSRVPDGAAACPHDLARYDVGTRVSSSSDFWMAGTSTRSWLARTATT